MSRASLTRRQRVVMAHLGGSTVSADALASALDTSREGAVMTASSLCRRGLAEKVRLAGILGYRLMPAGVEALRFEQMELVP